MNKKRTKLSDNYNEDNYNEDHVRVKKRKINDEEKENEKKNCSKKCQKIRSKKVKRQHTAHHFIQDDVEVDDDTDDTDLEYFDNNEYDTLYPNERAEAECFLKEQNSFKKRQENKYVYVILIKYFLIYNFLET